MKLTEKQEGEYQKRINEDISEKVYLQSTVVRVGILVTACLGGLVLFWAFKDPTMVQFKDVLTTLLVGFACTTLLYASKTFEHNRYVNIYRIHLDTTKAERDALSSQNRSAYEAKVFAFDLMRDWHSTEMIQHGTSARTFVVTHKSKIVAAMNDPGNVDKRQSVMVVLNYFERVSLACQTKMADNSLIKGYFRGVFNLYFSGLEEYIHQTRKQKDNYKLFEYYESVVTQWRTEESQIR